jgi:hypothetical protein
MNPILFRRAPPSPRCAMPPRHWQDYDIPTFKRRGIRLSIAQKTAHH